MNTLKTEYSWLSGNKADRCFERAADSELIGRYLGTAALLTTLTAGKNSPSHPHHGSASTHSSRLLLSVMVSKVGTSQQCSAQHAATGW